MNRWRYQLGHFDWKQLAAYAAIAALLVFVALYSEDAQDKIMMDRIERALEKLEADMDRQFCHRLNQANGDSMDCSKKADDE